MTDLLRAAPVRAFPQGWRGKRVDIGGVAFAHGLGQARGERLGPRVQGADFAGSRRIAIAGAQCQRGLATAQKLDIDLGQDFRVEQRAMLVAGGIVDAEARAQRVQAV